MSLVVAVPIQFASIKLHVEKGRHWSVVEHVLLEAICRKPQSAAQLARNGNIPLRLVIEGLINLMRAGWADIRASGDHMVFGATAGGEAVVGMDTLPPVTRPLSRSTRFAIEQVSGNVLRWREITFVPSGSPRLNMSGLVRLPVNQGLPPRSGADIIETLLDDDERYRGSDISAAKPGNGFALVTLAGKKVIGLPRSASQSLREAIRLVAQDYQAPIPNLIEEPEFPVETFRMASRPASILTSDLLLGGDVHRKVLEEMIERAESLIVIHSTFITMENFEKLFPAIERAAVQRGVHVHLFIGKIERFGEQSKTARALERAREWLKHAGLTGHVHLHPFSTESHAKLVVADNGRGQFEVLIGSCNWLSSNFQQIEISIRLHDATLVGEVLSSLAQMAFAATGRDSGPAFDFAGIAVNLARQPESRGRSIARIVFGPEHARIVELARDDAKRRIVIGSHRFGAAAETLTLIPARAAIGASQDLAVSAYYGLGSEGADASTRAANDSDDDRIAFIECAALHAKFLAWDDDNVLITSHNLLSADPSSPWAEIGVHVRSPGIANSLIAYLESTIQ